MQREVRTPALQTSPFIHQSHGPARHPSDEGGTDYRNIVRVVKYAYNNRFG